ncbi:MAG: hypothetical protein HDQ88_05380 [Clostridia bacterium]|nr:hypothetical protein [Clostridia bacterium]
MNDLVIQNAAKIGVIKTDKYFTPALFGVSKTNCTFETLKPFLRYNAADLKSAFFVPLHIIGKEIYCAVSGSGNTPEVLQMWTLATRSAVFYCLNNTSMESLLQKSSMQQGCTDAKINVSDLSYELENVLGFFDHLNGEDAISNLTFLIGEYSKPGYDECVVERAAVSTMRLCTDIVIIRDMLKRVYERFCKEGGIYE